MQGQLDLAKKVITNIFWSILSAKTGKFCLDKKRICEIIVEWNKRTIYLFLSSIIEY